MYSFMIIVNGMATRSIRHVICQKCLLPMTTYYAMLITLQWPLMNIISLCSISYVDIIHVLLTSFHMYRNCVFLSKRCRIIPTSRRDIHNELLYHQWTLVIVQMEAYFHVSSPLRLTAPGNGDETVRITVPKLFSSMSIDMSKSWEFLPDKLRTSWLFSQSKEDIDQMESIKNNRVYHFLRRE